MFLLTRDSEASVNGFFDDHNHRNTRSQQPASQIVGCAKKL